ncbi:hypothetical protein SCLCIDRAFT_1019912 [Scleroderma citrinum Foug A]|uniref:DUF7918 domain-containing protein n=1 Tax=Scleroderma citrinum Foug A TaxID=1036808 RepID=A0A0C2ZC13_9AGAM|nr:hypothetical protein SCLCIDRAFT_1019912 [Scleroderma citrinum Foug A]
MLQFNDIFAFIEVDSQELPQYGIDIIPEENTVACWVASQPDKHFSVTYGHTRQNDAFDIKITTDGLRCGKVLGRSRTGTIRKVIGVPTSPTSVRPYMFSKLQLTDEDQYLNIDSSHMGEIRVDFYRTVVLKKRSKKKKRYDVCEPLGLVHECVKKTLSHCVSLGSEVSRPAKRSSCVMTKRLDTNPLASFIFRYREHSILRANGIIPQPIEGKRTTRPSGEGQNPPLHVKKERRRSLHAKEEQKPTPLPQDVHDLTIENVINAKTEDIKPIDAAIRPLRRSKRTAPAARSPSTSASQPPAKRIKRESKKVKLSI